MATPSEIRIEGIRLEECSGRHRAAAEVDGETLYFESDQAELRPSPEAFAAALLVPAMARGANLVVEAPLDPVFTAGIPRLVEIFAGWWGYQRIAVRSAPLVSLPVGRRTTPGSSTALCFSGGADSFFSLLRNEKPIHSLVFVHGFDMRLAEEARAASFVSSLDRVAHAVSARPILLRTNLRDHSLGGHVNWVHAHGGALAAVGHVVSGISQLIVAASYPLAFPQPWGSRWDIDPHWSASHMQVVHHGAGSWRAEKLRSLASHPLVRSHLRVCWEHRSRQANCSRCEKCVRTMLTLAQCGVLDAFPVFDSSRPLSKRVEDLGRIAPDLQPVYHAFLEPEIDPDTSRAVRALLSASQVPPVRRARWRKVLHALLR